MNLLWRYIKATWPRTVGLQSQIRTRVLSLHMIAGFFWPQCKSFLSAEAGWEIKRFSFLFVITFWHLRLHIIINADCWADVLLLCTHGTLMVYARLNILINMFCSKNLRHSFINLFELMKTLEGDLMGFIFTFTFLCLNLTFKVYIIFWKKYLYMLASKWLPMAQRNICLNST